MVFPSSVREQHLDINCLELLTIIVALRLWGSRWCGLRLTVRCDKTAVTVLNTGPCRFRYSSKGVHSVFLDLWFFPPTPTPIPYRVLNLLILNVDFANSQCQYPRCRQMSSTGLQCWIGLPSSPRLFAVGNRSAKGSAQVALKIPVMDCNFSSPACMTRLLI